MKYNYRVEFLKIGGDKRLVFRLPDELRVVEIFMNSDIQSEYMSKKFKDYCTQVQKGKLKEKAFSSNNCSTTIKPDYVQIMDKYSEENNVISIETSELILLIEAFVNEIASALFLCFFGKVILDGKSLDDCAAILPCRTLLRKNDSSINLHYDKVAALNGSFVALTGRLVE
jgi:hypothetical protein